MGDKTPPSLGARYATASLLIGVLSAWWSSCAFRPRDATPGVPEPIHDGKSAEERGPRRRGGDRCGLYLAPSSLPHAGLGLYSGADVPHEASVNEHVGGGTRPDTDDGDEDAAPLWTDVFVAVADLYLEYKALPYRGQQRFPSWLQYVWQETPGAFPESETLPKVHHSLWGFDEGLNHADGLRFGTGGAGGRLASGALGGAAGGGGRRAVSAFAPGIASLANSHAVFSNVDRRYAAPHRGVEFYVTEEAGIAAGQELVRNAFYILGELLLRLSF